MATVLLADADRALRDAYHAFLSRRGFHVDNAGDGLVCLAKLRGFVPDLLILDLELPWGGGDGVLGFLREHPRLLPNRVILTSAVGPLHVLDGLASPLVVQALMKPFPLSVLLERAALVASVEPTHPSADDQHHRNAVADDESVAQDFLQTKFQQEGLHAATADDGYLPSPETLRELEEQIQRRLSGNVHNLRLSIRDNGVVLAGQTRTYYTKQLAQHTVMEAIDLPIHANEIEVV